LAKLENFYCIKEVADPFWRPPIFRSKRSLRPFWRGESVRSYFPPFETQFNIVFVVKIDETRTIAIYRLVIHSEGLRITTQWLAP